MPHRGGLLQGLKPMVSRVVTRELKLPPPKERGEKQIPHCVWDDSEAARREGLARETPVGAQPCPERKRRNAAPSRQPLSDRQGKPFLPQDKRDDTRPAASEGAHISTAEEFLASFGLLSNAVNSTVLFMISIYPDKMARDHRAVVYPKAIPAEESCAKLPRQAYASRRRKSFACHSYEKHGVGWSGSCSG